MKYALILLLAGLGLTACDRYNELVTKYDPDGVLRCMAVDVASTKAAEQGITLADWVKTENIAVCPVK